MATSLITGLLTHPTAPTLHASSPRRATMANLPLPETAKHTNNLSAIEGANLILLCVKPNAVPGVISELAPALATTQTPVLSVAAGVSIAAMEAVISETIGAVTPVLRAMPSTSAAQNASVTALCPGSRATETHLHEAESVLAAVGDVVVLPEYHFATATAIAGAGPAYLFMMAEAMADAGVRSGLNRDIALRLAAGTVLGAGKTLVDAWKHDVHPAVLRNRVESPGGVTIAGTTELERQGFRADVIDAVWTAFERAREMEK